MNRLIWTAAALLVLGHAKMTLAGDYLIHIKSFGYENSDVHEKRPTDEFLGSLELVARPDVPFQSRTRIGRNVLSLKGKLVSLDTGLVSLQLIAGARRETGEFVQIAEGLRRQKVNQTESRTSLELRLNQRITLGGFESREQLELPDGSKVDRMSKRIMVLQLSEFKPGEPTPAEIEEADREQIQGTWQAVEVIANGQVKDAESILPIKFVVSGSQWTRYGPGPEIDSRRVGFQLYAGVPKIIDFLPPGLSPGGVPTSAIYQLEGNSLTVCIPNGDMKSPPAEFKSEVGSNVELFRLTRVKQ